MTHILVQEIMVQLLIQYYSVGISKQPNWSPLMKVMHSSCTCIRKGEREGGGEGGDTGQSVCVSMDMRYLLSSLLRERIIVFLC